MLQVKRVSYAYDERKKVLEDLCFSLQAGDILGISGESGCGKSTLCYLLLGLLRPRTGEILFKGSRLPYAKDRRGIASKIQYVMQNPESAFNPRKTMEYSLNELRHFLQERDGRDLVQEIERGMEDVSLEQSTLKRRPDELSGGQLQRYGILRALLMQPELLILDEVTSMLDTLVQAKTIRVLQEVKEKRNLTYIMVSHDKALLSAFADRTLILREGRIV